MALHRSGTGTARAVTWPDPEIFAAMCARGTASFILRIPQYVVYFALVLVASRVAYPSYPWRTSLRDGAVGFVIFVTIGLIERQLRRKLGRWTTSIERRAIGSIARSIAAHRARESPRSASIDNRPSASSRAGYAKR